MSIVVQKYGGSSVATPEKLKEVARRIIKTRDEGHSVVVVVSAMADTTNDLLTLSKQVSLSPERRELDMLLTAGERISMALLSMAIKDLGGSAISFTGSQAGILTNDRHVDARIIEVRPIRVQDELEKGRIVIVAGYQGMSYKREITTLGRGGSDTTAVALAAALGAEWCEICSDVDGVYSADPRGVPNAHRISELGYEETSEMAESGAKVLNAQAVEFAEANDIAIYARATAGAIPGDDPGKDGTVVRRLPARNHAAVVGIASQKEIVLLKGGDQSLETVLEHLAKFEVDPGRMDIEVESDGRSRFLIRLSPENLHQLPALESALAGFEIIKGVGSVSAIGSGINSDPGVLIRGSHCLSEQGFSLVSTSPRRITWVLPSEKVDEATRLLHAGLIEVGLP